MKKGWHNSTSNMVSETAIREMRPSMKSAGSRRDVLFKPRECTVREDLQSQTSHICAQIPEHRWNGS